MRHNLKAAAVSALAIMAALAMSIPAYAADKKISEVKFRVNAKPEAGDSIGDPDVQVTKGNVEITEQEFDNDDSEWERGDKPVIYLTIEAKDGYQLSGTKLSATKSAYKVTKRSGDKSEWKVKITMSAVDGDLDTVEDLSWSNRTATWDSVSYASKYEVKLYRNSSTVTTVTITGTSYNFYPYMTKSGDYTFKVRAVDGSDKGEWSDESDEYYMNSSDVYTGTPPTDNSSGGSTPANANGQMAKNLGNTYTIHTAANGKEALECLETTTVDLIISDIVMPHMDGFELLKSIRSDNMLCHIPFILLSALDSIDSKIAGLDYGADAYIEKPFSLSHMKATINNLLENRRMLFNHFTTVPNMSYDQTLMNKTDVKWLNTINEIIIRNFTNEEFTIDKMAEEMAISRSNLQRKLKGLTGMPPNDYIRLIRLKTAGELLREGEYRINEVCFIVGFNNPSYFARCFQKQFGILPKDYVKGGDITHSQKGTTSISP